MTDIEKTLDLELTQSVILFLEKEHFEKNFYNKNKKKTHKIRRKQK